MRENLNLVTLEEGHGISSSVGSGIVHVEEQVTAVPSPGSSGLKGFQKSPTDTNEVDSLDGFVVELIVDETEASKKVTMSTFPVAHTR